MAHFEIKAASLDIVFLAVEAHIGFAAGMVGEQLKRVAGLEPVMGRRVLEWGARIATSRPRAQTVAKL